MPLQFIFSAPIINIFILIYGGAMMTKRTGSARPVVKNSTQSNQRNHRRNSGRKTSFFYKVVAAIFIIAIIGGGGYAVKNFSTSGENYKTHKN